MTDELEFSVMADDAAALQPLLDQFTAETGQRVRLRRLSWDTAWSDLVKVALYSDGPDLSEIGSTWLGDLVAMNALHPFQPAEMSAWGGPSACLPSAWPLGRLVGQPEVWGIPWCAGARLLFYRRSLLARAGLDPQTAFGTAEALDHSLESLQRAGVAHPWTVPTGLTHTTLLNVASWVWGAGGDFVSVDGQRTRFSQPAARAGLRAYLALGRYLSPQVRQLNGLQPDQQFLRDAETAVTLSGPWLFADAPAEVATDLGVALPPGVPFVGGSALVVWKHTRRREAALALIEFLMRTPAQVANSKRIGLLPTTLAALAAPPYATHPHWQLAIQALKAGRSFLVTRAWGLMEDRLTTELSALWSEVLTKPELDLEAALARRLEPLAARLDLVLGQS